MYDVDGFLIDNPINRYLLRSNDVFEFNKDGSLTLYIQHEAPDERTSNWLPAPQGDFSVLMRLYDTKPEFANGKWEIPPLNRVNNNKTK